MILFEKTKPICISPPGTPGTQRKYEYYLYLTSPPSLRTLRLMKKQSQFAGRFVDVITVITITYVNLDCFGRRENKAR